jgi:hypothetical protein
MNILDIKMQENDADAATIKDYLKCLLTLLWNQGEGFNSKRPFGNSCWDFELYKALITAEVVKGTLDEDGGIDEFSNVDRSNADELIFKAIESL